MHGRERRRNSTECSRGRVGRTSSIIPCFRTRYDQSNRSAELFFPSVYIAVYRAIKREIDHYRQRFHHEVPRTSESHRWVRMGDIAVPLYDISLEQRNVRLPCFHR